MRSIRTEQSVRAVLNFKMYPSDITKTVPNGSLRISGFKLEAGKTLGIIRVDRKWKKYARVHDTPPV